MRKIKLKLTPFEAKLMFNILIDKQKETLEEIDNARGAELAELAEQVKLIEETQER